ncbi:copper amine oxidase N-terminal domain-containing protein [Paenibacillus sedimenti]|uniref:Copper amine oxidase N-terminal domain-containing protein n=1 Tax=Paenibacillus sedimenti TaxID=2770274 RepID=A0A926KME9_9BACL|nr:copper amine oxidase N-terminal domain-containing protein [Paenibacillus sedimenti]MBD0378938.1 copper amine oxidase N-terminal domain-containing protein [Paenibacillus sedimenti]
MYASDNGTIKETQYYVLEIETPEGSIKSQPIKYKNPMISEGTPAPVPAPVPTPSPVPAPSLFLRTDRKILRSLCFSKGQNFILTVKDGRTLVPFRKLFETLGFTVKWVEEGSVRKAIGTKNGLSIELTINSTNGIVNCKAVALDVPAQIIDGHTMVPLRFVSESSGNHVAFSSSGNVWTIKIEDAAPGTGTEPTPAPAPAPTPEQHQARNRHLCHRLEKLSRTS